MDRNELQIRVSCPKGMNAKSLLRNPETLATIQAQRPLDLPVARTAPLGLPTRRLVQRVLQASVRSDFRDCVDLGRGLLLVEGARAVLQSELEAATTVLWDFLEVASTSGFLVDDWRVRYAAFLYESALGMPAETTDSAPVSKIANSAPLAQAPSEFSEASAASGATLNAHEFLTLLRVRKKFAERNIDLEVLDGVLDELDDLIELDRVRKSAELETAEIPLLKNLKDQVSSMGLDNKDVSDYVNFHRNLQSLGFNAALAESVSLTLGAIQSEPDANGRGVELLLELAERGVSYVDKIAELERRCSKQQNVLRAMCYHSNELEAQIRADTTRALELQERIAGLDEATDKVLGVLQAADASVDRAISIEMRIQSRSAVQVVLGVLLENQQRDYSRPLLLALEDFILAVKNGEGHLERASKMRRIIAEGAALIESNSEIRENLVERQRQLVAVGASLVAAELELEKPRTEMVDEKLDS